LRFYGDVSATNWLFRPLAHLPKRVVLDANVLLDLALMVDSVSSISLRILQSQGYHFFTSECCVDEAESALRKFIKSADISPLIKDVCKAVGITTVASTTEVAEVKKHDAHIAAVTAEVGGFLASEDIALIGQMNSARLHARTLRELAIGLAVPDRPRQDLMAFGSGLGANGYFFIKCMAHLALTANNNRSFYICDIGQFGTLAYNGRIRSFEFTSERDGTTLAVKFEPMPGRQVALLLEYDVGKRDTIISLKVKHFDGGDEARAERRIAPLKRAPAQEFTVMNRRQHDLGWLGDLQNISWGPHKLNPSTWKVCSSLVGVAPSTLTADLAFLAALLVHYDAKAQMVRRPTLTQVRTFANVSVAFLYPGRRRGERDPYLPHPAVEWLEKEYGTAHAKKVAKDW
jgi:hypothetical protein